MHKYKKPNKIEQKLKSSEMVVQKNSENLPKESSNSLQSAHRGRGIFPDHLKNSDQGLILQFLYLKVLKWSVWEYQMLIFVCKTQNAFKQTFLQCLLRDFAFVIQV